MKIIAAKQSINQISAGHCTSMGNIFRFADHVIKLMERRVKKIRFENVNEKKKLAATNLKSICEKIVLALYKDDLKIKISKSDRLTTAKRCNEILEWLTNNQSAEINESELRHEELKTLNIPIWKTLNA